MPRLDSRGAAGAYAGLVLTTLFWAGNAVIARAVIHEIPPFALSFWRWALALVIILPFGLPQLRGHWPLIRANWRQLLLLCALSVGGYNTLLYLAAHTTTAVNITLVNATSPMLITLLAWGILRQPVTARQLLGIALAVAGILVIVTQGRLAVLTTLDFRRGDLIMVGAVSIWALYSVLLRRHSDLLLPIPQLGFLTLTILGGLPLILPFYLGEMVFGKAFFPSTESLPTLVAIAVFPGILAYALWNHGVAVLGPSRTGMFIYLMPLFAAVLASVFLDEYLQGFHVGGGLLILGGLYLATRSRRSAPSQ